jgi:uncharacterized protein HemY
LCEAELEKIRGKEGTEHDQYWILATQAEAALGQGDAAKKDEYLERARPLADDWMLESTQNQLDRLSVLQEDSPLKYIVG